MLKITRKKSENKNINKIKRIIIKSKNKKKKK